MKVGMACAERFICHFQDQDQMRPSFFLSRCILQGLNFSGVFGFRVAGHLGHGVILSVFQKTNHKCFGWNLNNGRRDVIDLGMKYLTFNNFGDSIKNKDCMHIICANRKKTDCIQPWEYNSTRMKLQSFEQQSCSAYATDHYILDSRLLQ